MPLAEAIEITEVRMVVEGLCAAKAAQRVTEAEIAELREIRAGMSGAVEAGEIQAARGHLGSVVHALRKAANRTSTRRVGVTAGRAQSRTGVLRCRPQPDCPVDPGGSLTDRSRPPHLCEGGRSGCAGKVLAACHNETPGRIS
ncbi:FCD domain-containing protein [Streptomyces sp900105755]|uniref:FCD domain-containing protein n=1 Tax=Streptomyces sp. 900105755 TaxID=3154389 RepID=UPI003324E432